MKKIKLITFLLLMAYTTISEAQTIAFSYDAAGNRTKREIIFQKSSKVRIDSTLTSGKPVADIEPITELMDKMKITIYPNPTLGQLSVEITSIPRDVSGEIKIYNITGNVIQQREKLGPLNQLDLSAYPAGIYILYLRIGQEESKWKIIKK